MLKCAFFFIISVLAVNIAICKTADTTIRYFKTIDGINIHVESLDSADYFRLILPSDSGDARYNIQEYYKNGKIKFVGKASTGDGFLSPKSDGLILDGDCISYYPNGKKSSISHYKEGYKDAFEYLFYPNGTIYCCLKHLLANSKVYNETLDWECYDPSGKMICKAGNGKWIVYDNEYKYIKFEGQVVNGYMEGEWRGSITKPDTIKYIYKYKKGSVLSSIGYDRKGNTYLFKKEIEPATYRSGQLTFVEVLRSHIKLPRDTNGEKASIDTVHISFVVEKDGHISEFKISDKVNPRLKEAVLAGLEKCNNWSSAKIYGVPLRTQIVIPLKEISGYSGDYYIRLLGYKEKVLKDD
jgi:antitoxin component YwqK of YwqJK toxin-antitoxin module